MAHVHYTLHDALSAAHYAQRINSAYIKIAALGTQMTNREHMMQALALPELITPVDRDAAAATLVHYRALAWRSLQVESLNSFERTVFEIIELEHTRSNHDLAIIAALPSCVERDRQRRAVESRIAWARGSVGALGERPTLCVTVLQSVWSQQWGTTFVTAITAADGVVRWSTGKRVAVGAELTVRGTVRSVDARGVTKLARVTIVHASTTSADSPDNSQSEQTHA